MTWYLYPSPLLSVPSWGEGAPELSPAPSPCPSSSVHRPTDIESSRASSVCSFAYGAHALLPVPDSFQESCVPVGGGRDREAEGGKQAWWVPGPLQSTRLCTTGPRLWWQRCRGSCRPTRRPCTTILFQPGHGHALSPLPLSKQQLVHTELSRNQPRSASDSVGTSRVPCRTQ